MVDWELHSHHFLQTSIEVFFHIWRFYLFVFSDKEIRLDIDYDVFRGMSKDLGAKIYQALQSAGQVDINRLQDLDVSCILCQKPTASPSDFHLMLLPDGVQGVRRKALRGVYRGGLSIEISFSR